MTEARALPIALALGAVSACGFAPLDLWPLTLACLAMLADLIGRATSLRRAAAIGWWFGLGHFTIGLNWIATAFTYQAAMPAWLGWIAVMLLSLYLAAFVGIGLGGAWLLARWSGRGLSPFLGAGWIVGEWLRATVFTGFAWNPLAAIWVPVPGIAHAVAWIGTYALSGLTMLAAALFAAIVRGAADRRAARPMAAAAGFAVLAAIVAGLAAIRTPLIGSPGLRIRVVQPNINQAEKWEEGAEMRNFMRLVRLTGRPGPEPRLVLWPEVAIPWYLEEDPEARAALARLLGPGDLMLTGGIAARYDDRGAMVAATNSLFGLDPRGRLLGRYDKSHLVPYGEYLPMRPILSRLGLSRLAPGDMDFDSGPGPRDLTLPGIGPVGGQICYEIIFSGHVVDRAHRPRFLFNPSNDAWFGRWGPPQHLAQARLRAVEEAVPIIRSTPTGISAVIDARGRLLASLPWHKAGAIDATLPAVGAPTLFARWGNLLAGVVIAILLACGFASRRRLR